MRRCGTMASWRLRTQLACGMAITKIINRRSGQEVYFRFSLREAGEAAEESNAGGLRWPRSARWTVLCLGSERRQNRYSFPGNTSQTSKRYNLLWRVTTDIRDIRSSYPHTRSRSKPTILTSQSIPNGRRAIKDLGL